MVSQDGEAPSWSPDGGLLYFWSDRDGSPCLWAQRLDPATKRPAGSPLSIQHFHTKGLSWKNLYLGAPDIAVARDKVVFNLGEHSGNIWMTQLPHRRIEHFPTRLTEVPTAPCVRASGAKQSDHAPTRQPGCRSPRPDSEPHRQHDRRRGPAARPRRRSRRRPRHRRILCARGRGGRDRQARPLARSTAALLSGQAPRGPGAVRRRPHRHAARRARQRTAWRASSTPATRAWSRPTTSSRSRSWAVPIPIPIYTRFFTPATNALPADARRDRPPVRRRDGARDREVAGGTSRRTDAARADRRCVLGRHRQRRRVSRHLPHDDAGSACRRRGSRPSC